MADNSKGIFGYYSIQFLPSDGTEGVKIMELCKNRKRAIDLGYRLSAICLGGQDFKITDIANPWSSRVMLGQACIDGVLTKEQRKGVTSHD